MKKKVLFIMNNLTCGGAEKALVSLLQQMDYSKYEVDLFLFSHSGLFLKQLPAEVNLLPEPENYRYFDMPVKKAVIENLKSGNIGVAISRVLFGFVHKTEKIAAQKEQRSWKYLAAALPKLPKKYNVAVGFLEKMPNYFCIDKVDADVKIGFIHTDYNGLEMDPAIDLPYFKKFTKIFTISEACQAILEETFPSVRDKFGVMLNIVSPDLLKKLAASPLVVPKDKFTLVSVGRLHPLKGFDIAVEAAKILKDRGAKFCWYVIGEGNERRLIESKISEYGLQDVVILLGMMENPYPYVAMADVYVQPSRSEGKSIAIDEAKILGKPIVVTNFPSVVDQITHKKNGYIADINPVSIADAISALLNDRELREQLMHNLRAEKLGTEGEIEKLYEVFGLGKIM